MALRRNYNKRFKGVSMRSGHFYKFKYTAWENDPRPTIILMYALEGTHPNTGNQFRFFQAINFTYIPRTVRKRFLNEWMRIYQSGNPNDLRFTWELIKRKYPWLKIAVRRYFFKPNYYMTALEEIPIDRIEKEVISTWNKDFSKKVKTALINKFRNVFKRRKQTKKDIRRSRRI